MIELGRPTEKRMGCVDKIRHWKEPRTWQVMTAGNSEQVAEETAPSFQGLGRKDFFMETDKPQLSLWLFQRNTPEGPQMVLALIWAPRAWWAGAPEDAEVPRGSGCPCVLRAPQGFL